MADLIIPSVNMVRTKTFGFYQLHLKTALSLALASVTGKETEDVTNTGRVSTSFGKWIDS